MQSTLHCHPSTPDQAVRALQVSVRSLSGGALCFSFDLSGEMTNILIPSPVPPIASERADDLWRHTCFEAFVSVVGENAYHEFNFSPDGRWAAYAFSTYRQKQPSALQLTPPECRIQVSANRLRLTATLMPDALPQTMRSTTTLDIGLSAVIETAGEHANRCSYWALRHPAEHPDFHDRRGFVLQLPMPQPISRNTLR